MKTFYRGDLYSRWSVAMAFAPATFKTEFSRPQRDVAGNEFIVTWQGRSWMNYVFISYNIIPFSRYRDVINDV